MARKVIMVRGTVEINGLTYPFANLEFADAESIEEVRQTMVMQVERGFGADVVVKVEPDLGPLKPDEFDAALRKAANQIIQDVLVDIEQRKPPFWAKTWKGARYESARPGRYFRR